MPENHEIIITRDRNSEDFTVTGMDNIPLSVLHDLGSLMVNITMLDDTLISLEGSRTVDLPVEDASASIQISYGQLGYRVAVGFRGADMPRLSALAVKDELHRVTNTDD